MQNTTGKIICAEYNKENNFHHYNFDPLAPSCLGSPISPENGQQKDSVININLRRCKTRITWNRSQIFRFYKCYDICFYNFCNKHLLKWKKNTSEVWNNDSPNISPIFFYAAGSRISIWIFFYFPFLLHLSEIFGHE